VPDRDIIYATLAQPWRRAYRLARGDASADVVARAAEKALAETLRRSKGCPGLDDLAAAVVRGIREGGSAWQDQADSVVHRFWHSQHTRTARQIADAFVEAHGAESASDTDAVVARRFGSEVLRRLTLQYGFGPVQSTLAAARFGSTPDTINFENTCLAMMRLEPMAARLLANPEAQGLRAPVERRTRTTADMLDTWP